MLALLNQNRKNSTFLSLMRKLYILVIFLHSTLFSFAQNIIWSSDFSNCDDWVLGNAFNEGFTQYDPEVNFSCGTTSLVYNKPPFLSTTNSNGFMTVSSNNSQWGDISGPVENCWFQTAESIDITGLDEISIRFQSTYKNDGFSIFQGPNSPRLLVEVSTDGVTWPDVQTTALSANTQGKRFHLWSEYSTPQFIIANPKEEVFILSDVASQQDVNQIWLRFRWVGTFDMEWKIDDVQIVSNPQHDLAITNAWLNNIYEAYEYSSVPLGFADDANPINLLVAVRNYSNSSQNAEVTFNLGGQSFTGSRLLGPGAVDSVLIENVVYPQSPGIYEATFSLPEDDNPNGNVFTKNVEVSTSIYRQTMSDDLFEITLGPGSDLAASVFYGAEISGATSFEYSGIGVNVLFGPNTAVGGQVYVELLSYDENNPVAAESQVFTITNEIYNDILSGQYVFIPFVESVLLQPLEYYAVRVSKVVGSETISFFVDTRNDDYGGLITDLSYNPLYYNPGLVLQELFPYTPAVDLVFNVSGCMDINACNYNPTVSMDNGNCIYPLNSYVDCDGNCFNDANNNGVCDELDIEGCTDITACNYSAEATIENGTCSYPASEILNCNGECINDINNNGICDPLEIFGCTDPTACNYQSDATFYDGSCIYEFDLSIVAFNDLNEDGIYDMSSEPVVPYAGHFLINPGNILAYISYDGAVHVPSLPAGDYTLTFFNNMVELSPSLDNSNLLVSIPNCATVEMPMTANDGCFAYFETIHDYDGSGIHCQDGFWPSFRLFNFSESLVDATVTMSFDPSLNFNAQETIYSSSYLEPSQYEISNPTPGLLVWQLNQIPMNLDIYFGVQIIGPGVEYIGQTYNFDYTVSVLCDGNSVYETTWTSNLEVTCAYDPNDIQGNPEGYTENHFILSDTEIEYRIRFQNTGNAPALDVVIENLIDAELLDLSTFQPTSSSHPMSAILEPNGMAKFIFNGIMLPDSSANLQGSMGYLTYKIRTMPGISVGEVINNSASIFFDLNPPIYTNTAFHEIYSCDEIPQVDESYAICYGDFFNYQVSYPYLESTQWYVNDQQISSDANVSIPIVFEDDLNIQLVMTNPLCEVTSQWTIEELPSPSSEIVYNEFTNELTAIDGVAWQWYTTSGIIPGATEQTFDLDGDGTFYVIITNEEGCSVISELFNFVGILEKADVILSAYPNPVEDELRLNASPELVGTTYFIHDITGREVGRGVIIGPTLIINLSAQSSGSYVLRAGGNSWRFQKR